ncbi:branched-chain amino acid transport system permease protein [Microvirga lupini]|uniref:Branched-chain amino acid transport system permease protein n=1 Tax=Microvirga lupini TaxID=420324 RepID=A0A7W4YZK5_9HYPH|nr:branched-chain amino acid ABC transporter permease [Microvirga lupini]MBB3021379.1 branched-chain amino acid transport system permease protein [Microvirga lupini]
MSGYWAGILSILAINIVFAYGIFLPVATGQLNLGGAGFQALGAYAAAYASASFGLPVYVTIPLAALLAGAIGALIAFPILRTRGVYLVLATFAFAEVVAGSILNSETLGGAMGLSVPAFIDWQIPVAVAVLVSLFVFYLMSTRFGLTMRAAHDDEVVTDLMGVNIRKTQVTAFGLGAALAGLAGGLYAHTFSFVEIQGFNAVVSIYVLLYVLLGGTQTAWGPIVGATFFTMLPEVLRETLPTVKQTLATLVGITEPVAPPDESWRLVILGVLTVLMMAFRPEGLITRTMMERLQFRRSPSRAAAEVSA